jgi:hypothetical protein
MKSKTLAAKKAAVRPRVKKEKLSPTATPPAAAS